MVFCMIREEILDWTSYLKEHLSNARSSVKIFSFYLIIIFNDLLYFKKTNNKSFLKCEVSRVLGLVSRPVDAIRVSGGGLEPSNEYSWQFSWQAWQVTSHSKSQPTPGNKTGGSQQCVRLSDSGNAAKTISSKNMALVTLHSPRDFLTKRFSHHLFTLVSWNLEQTGIGGE